MVLDTPNGLYHIAWDSDCELMANIERAKSDSARGWVARHYNQLEPALSLMLLAKLSSGRMWTMLSPASGSCEMKDNVLTVSINNNLFNITLEQAGKVTGINKQN